MKTLNDSLIIQLELQSIEISYGVYIKVYKSRLIIETTKLYYLETTTTINYRPVIFVWLDKPDNNYVIESFNMIETTNLKKYIITFIQHLD